MIVDGLTTTKRMSSLEYVITTNKLATLYELRYVYDVWEAIDLYEACLVQLHNKAVMIKEGGRK